MNTKTLNTRGAFPWIARMARQAGVGLVEVMVSITIGLVIIAALVALFVGTSRNNREMASANNMIENGRFAIQLLEEDVVHAGYWGEFAPTFDDQTFSGDPSDWPKGIPSPCTDPAVVVPPGKTGSTPTWSQDYQNEIIGIPVQTYDTATFCSGVVSSKEPKTDVLVVRHLDRCAIGEVGCDAAKANELYMQSPLCVDDTGLPPRLGVWGGSVSFDLYDSKCPSGGVLAPIRKFVSQIYYVRTAITDPVTKEVTPPTLMRSSFELGAGTVPVHQAAEALIEGIDGLRVELGVDNVSITGGAVVNSVKIDWADVPPTTKYKATNRGDGIPDGNYVHCTDLSSPPNCSGAAGAALLSNVTSVKIYVLARSREAVRGYVDSKTYTLGNCPPLDVSCTYGPYNDAYKRHVYATTVRLPNVAGRRERP